MSNRSVDAHLMSPAAIALKTHTCFGMLSLIVDQSFSAMVLKEDAAHNRRLSVLLGFGGGEHFIGN